MDDETNPFLEQQPKQEAIVDDNIVRPIGVTVIGVLCTIAGVLGGLSSLSVLANVFLGEHFANMMNQGGPFAEAQEEFSRSMAEVNAKYFIPNLANGIIGFALALGFLVGGIGLLSNKPWSRKLLKRVITLAIVFEIARGAFYFLMQSEMAPITKAYMEKLGQSGSGGGGGMAQMSNAMVIVGFVFFAGWLAVKLGLLIWGRLYLASPTLDRYLKS